jgi:biotin transport system substrate-specific component
MRVLTNYAVVHTDSKLWSVLQVILASCFIGICAQISIPLYFTPIPLTGQTFGVLLSGAILGSRKGAMAALLYLVQGGIGFPVWAGGYGGAHYFFGVRGGYLLAYILEAYLIGRFLEMREGLTIPKITLIGFLICCIQLGIGVLWFSCFIGIASAFLLGFIPFVGGEFIKSLIVATIYKKYRGL